jgi:hypothetical protein
MIIGVLAYPFAITAVAFLIFLPVHIRSRRVWQDGWSRHLESTRQDAEGDAGLIVLDAIRDDSAPVEIPADRPTRGPLDSLILVPTQEVA